MKNLMGKTRTIDNPYETYTANNWTWKVLKKYQADDNKPFARWLCAVSSPYTHGGYDMGDVYAKEVLQSARKVDVS